MDLADFNSVGVRPSVCAEGSTPSHSRHRSKAAEIIPEELIGAL